MGISKMVLNPNFTCVLYWLVTECALEIWGFAISVHTITQPFTTWKRLVLSPVYESQFDGAGNDLTQAHD